MSGVSVAGTKLTAFALAAFIAGIAGAMEAYQQIEVSGPFDVLTAVSIFAIAYLGGITTVTGSVIGGLIAAGGVLSYIFQTYVFNGSANTIQIFYLLSGLGVILAAIQNPEGIAGSVPAQIQGVKRWFSGRREAAAALNRARAAVKVP
jgi:ABC-type branched-subunit amino acid transport system permease subunit